MRGILTAIQAAFGAKLATVIGSILPGIVLLPVPFFPTLPTVVRQLTVPSVMATAALFGWLLVRWRPMLSIEAVAAGLTCFSLLPLIALAGEGTLPGVLLGCAAETIVALSFTLPIALTVGVLETTAAKAGYMTVVCALFPLVLWWSTSSGGSQMISVAPLTTRVADNFAPPGVVRSGESFEAALGQALREGRVVADPKMRALRNAVVKGASALRAAPCDARTQSNQRIAVLNFVSEMPALSDRPNVEVFTAAGQTRQVTSTLNAPAGEAALETLRSGIVTIDDMPAWARQALAAKGTAAMPDTRSPLRCH